MYDGGYGMSHDDLVLSVHAQHVFERASVTIELIKIVFYSAIGGCFIAFCGDNPRRKLRKMMELIPFFCQINFFKSL